MSTAPDFTACEKMILDDEGFKPFVYKDSLQNDTIGIGFLLRFGFTLEECQAVLSIRVRRRAEDLARQAGSTWNTIDSVRQIALINMSYQIGVRGLLNFKEMWEAIKNKDWTKAYQEVLDSSYAKNFPKRASRNAKIILTGVLPS